MKLYKEASLMMLPTSVKDGKLYSIFPQPKVIGDNILTEPLDIDADFNTNGGGVIVDANTFTTAGGSLDGIISAVLVVGKNYKLEIKGTTTSNGFTIGNGTASGNEYGSGFGVHYFTAANASLWIRQNTAGTTDITTFTIKEVDQLPADFDFSRGADRATRVNEQGLVRPVEIVSDELVQNGDFEDVSETELVTNGDFDTDSDWTKAPSGVTIIGGSASFNSASVTYVFQDILTANKTYKVTFSGTVNSGSFYIGENGTPTNIYTAGTYTNEVAYFTVSSSARFIIRKTGVGTLDASIDNVSVKELGQNWDFGTGWSYEDGKAVCDGTNITYLTQVSILSTGKSYKIQFDIVDYTSGSVKYRDNGLVSGQSFSGANSYTDYVVAGGGQFRLMSENFIGSIDNISVVEVTEATDLPRLDWSGECPSLLLEPQRTNLVTHSEKVDEYSNSNTICTSNYSLSPEGVNNSTKVRFISSSTNSLGQDISVSSGDSVTQSIFVKYIDTQFVQLWFGSSGFAGGHANFDLINNQTSSYSGASSSIESFGNGWYRISTTKQASSSNSNTKGFALVAVDSLTSLRFNDEVDGSVEVFGAQAEQGSYATSYIPTRGQSATRAYDYFENTNLGDYLGTGDATFFFNFDFDVVSREGSGILYRIFSGNNFFGIKGINGANRDMQVFTSSSGGNIFSGNISVDSDAFTSHKIAIRTTGSVIEAFYNGTKLTDTMTGTDTYAWSELRVNANNSFLAKSKEITMFAKSLSDNECINLTTI